jgi:hypothetical protein
MNIYQLLFQELNSMYDSNRTKFKKNKDCLQIVINKKSERFI